MTTEEPDQEGMRDLLGLAEAAELLEISKASVCDRRRRTYEPGDRLPPFPTPAAKLQCGPIWERAQIEAYAAEVDRLAALTWWERKYPDADLDELVSSFPVAGPRAQREERERLAHAARLEEVLRRDSPPEAAAEELGTAGDEDDEDD